MHEMNTKFKDDIKLSKMGKNRRAKILQTSIYSLPLSKFADEFLAIQFGELKMVGSREQWTFLFLSIPQLLLTQQIFNDRYIDVKQNKRLINSRYLEHDDVTETFCMATCSMLKEKCSSVNYNPDTKKCVLNNKEIDEDDVQLIDEDGWRFYAKTVIKLIFPLKVSKIQTRNNEANVMIEGLKAQMGQNLQGNVEEKAILLKGCEAEVSPALNANSIS